MTAAGAEKTEREALRAAKAAVRREAEARRRRLAPDEALRLSGMAQARVTALPEFEAAGLVCCYLALRGETDTALIIAACRERGIGLCVPARRPEGTYGLARLRPDTRLTRGPLGVAEPEDREWVALEEVALAVVPGVAFDLRGGRVGRGGGHIDRLLAADTGGKLFAVGLAFECQVFERVPVAEHDRRMQAVVTESRTIRSAAPFGKGR
ncbi:MAG: 5-formyltetrahydrofolate cyclo-ligase [Lentisphaerae bacterium]|nr:5-formyltetrahydrofolate cyclo-ligase [Lentisphaerota bacterium]